MNQKKWLFLILVVATVVVAIPTEAQALGRRARAKIVSVAPASGQTMVVTLLVRDRDSRDLPILVEYRIRGTKGWHPATMETDMSAVPSSEEGETFIAAWNAYEDLGTRYSRRVRLRTRPDVQYGKRKRSRRFEVALYGNVDAGAVSAATYPDLIADGRLDGLVLIDTRAPQDFAEGALPGAMNLSAEDIEEDGKTILDYPKDTRLVFYCYGGL